MCDVMRLRGSILFLFGFLLMAPFQSVASDEIQQVDIDTYFEEHKTTGRTMMTTKPLAVVFEGKIMSLPKANKTAKLQRALTLSQWDPMPVVNKSMFVASDQGKVVPIYVEDDVATYIEKTLKTGDVKNFEGFHVYSYSKGPAILVVGVK